MQSEPRQVQSIDDQGDIERKQDIFQLFRILCRNPAAITALVKPF